MLDYQRVARALARKGWGFERFDCDVALLLHYGRQDIECDKLGPNGDHSTCLACIREGARTWEEIDHE